MRLFSILQLCLFVAISHAAVKPSAEQLMLQVQKRYSNTSRFTATFNQKYHNRIFNKDSESSGKLYLQKPNRFRWDYEKPSVKSFIIDGKSLWVYEKRDGVAYRDKCFKQDVLTSSLSFLWGGGKIANQFKVAWKDEQISLIPKEKNGFFKELLLVVDLKTYRVMQSTVIDLDGNSNQFTFFDLKLNAPISSSIFKFKPSTDIQVLPVPGSCQ